MSQPELLPRLRRSASRLAPFLALLLGVLAALEAAAARPERPQWLPRAEGTSFRALAWNVSRGNFFDQRDEFLRVLAAIDADVLILDEMPGDRDGAAVAAVLAELGGDRPWQVAYGIGGGRFQRSSIAVRAPLRQLDGFDRLTYPRSQVRRWKARIPALAGALRENTAAGVATVGAVAELGGRRLLVVGVDLQCCGEGPGSWQEARRQVEARLIRDAVTAAVAASGIDAVLLGGDLNAVNGAAPVAILRGDERAQPLLSDVLAMHRGSGESWTWDGRGTEFPSGRLDFLMHCPGLQPLQAQVFDAEDLGEPEAAALGLDRALSRRLSQHRPVVVDFGWTAGAP